MIISSDRKFWLSSVTGRSFDGRNVVVFPLLLWILHLRWVVISKIWWNWTPATVTPSLPLCRCFPRGENQLDLNLDQSRTWTESNTDMKLLKDSNILLKSTQSVFQRISVQLWSTSSNKDHFNIPNLQVHIEATTATSSVGQPLHAATSAPKPNI